MKLKYYMRGIGIGIVFTAAVYTIAGRTKAMTTDEIIAEAKKLGMVEASQENNSNLGDILKEPSVTDQPKPEPTKEPSIDPTMEPNKEPTKVPTNQPTDSSIKTPTAMPSPVITDIPVEGGSNIETEESYVYLTITGGMTSQHVAELAKSKGLVDDAKAFDRYLIDNGYSSKILVNTYKIKMGAEQKEIAEAIVTRKEWVNAPKE